MGYPGLAYDFSDIPTEKQNEHAIHKTEGAMFTWCEYCRDEEMCMVCYGVGSKEGLPCDDCESSGRRI